MIGRLGRAAIELSKRSLHSMPTEKIAAYGGLLGQLGLGFSVSLWSICHIPMAADGVVNTFKRMRERYRQTGRIQ